MLQFALSIAVLSALQSAGESSPIESRISEIHLFKNGLAAVRRTAELPGPGSYRLEVLPAPVHGSFWVSSTENIAARASMQEVELPFDRHAGIDLQRDLEGKQVTIYFRDGTIPPVTGTVVASANSETAYINVLNETSYARSGSPADSYLVLQVGNDRIYVAASMIAYANVRDAGGTITESRPVLTLETDTKVSTAIPIEVSYLAHGVSWAPAYRIEISNPATLTIRQQAAIKNELENIEDVEVYLVSGFPAIEFSRVTSPLSTQVSWSQFFQQLQQRSGIDAMVMQQAVMSNSVLPPNMQIGFSAVPSGEGPDIHYQNVGTRTLARGDSLMFDVASASAGYRRLVEWIVPDTRSADGRLVNDPHGRATSENDSEDPWDVVQFENPFDFPMTTAPALVVADGRILGQTMSYWANRGETTRVRITKALSIRTAAEEHEIVGSREHIVVGGRDYRRTDVEGALHVSNHRAEDIELLVRRRFSGDLLDADAEPESRLLEEGAWSANRRNELMWNLTLAPGEIRQLTYRYTLLVLE